jgi:hypothetical protein
MKYLNAIVLVLLMCVFLAACGGGSGSSPSPADPRTPAVTTLAKPVALATNSPAEVIVEWANVPSATSYNLYWTPDSSLPSTQWTKVVNATSPYALSTQAAIIPGKTFYAVVTATNATMESAKSDVVAGVSTIANTVGWKSIPNTETSTVTAMAMDPTNANIVYAGVVDNSSSTNGRLYATTDAGATWTSTAVGNVYIYSIVVDPTKPSTLYVGAGTTGSNSNTKSGVYKSTDSGATFTQVLSSQYVYSLAMSPQNPSLLLAGTGSYLNNKGVVRSTDAGQTWTNATGLPSDATFGFQDIYDFGFNGTTIYCVSSQRGIYKSTDNGLTWGPTGLASATNTLSAISIGVSAQSPTTMYVGLGGSPSSNTTMQKSTDGGATWQALIGVSSSYYIQATLVLPSDPNTVFVASSGYGVGTSTDGGTTWTKLNTGLPSGLSLGDHSLVVNPYNPKIMFVGTDTGVYYTNSGGL